MSRLAALFLLLLCAAPAQAATVTVEPSNQRLTYEAAAGEVNRLTVSRENGAYRFTDVGTATATAQARAGEVSGAGFSCTRPANNVVECAVTGAWEIRVELGDLNDTALLETDAATTRVEGGVGNDKLVGGPGNDELRGDDGNDEVTGAGGVDDLRGGAGSDRIDARDGLRDELGCDDGQDRADVDVEDRVDADCEIVDRPLVPPVVTPAKPDAPGKPAETPAAAPVPLADDDVAPVEDVKPQAGKTVAAGVKRGSVLVKTAGGEAFAPLEGGAAVPVGATVDARAGVVRLTTASDLGGTTQTAEFTGGVFTVGQKRGAKMTTVLTLTGALDCGSRGKARAAAAKKKKARSRRLWGSGHGRFTTRGRNSQATVRGTIWSVEDRCDRTTTRVERGAVAVDDFATGKRTLVRAGGKHVARKRTKRVR